MIKNRLPMTELPVETYAPKQKMDLSSVQLDGSHTKCRLGGESVGFQARKMAKTTNSIFLADNLGQILAFGSPKSGNFHEVNI